MVETAPNADQVERFAALANPIRLAAFRLLMPLGPGGLPAGEIAKAMGVPPSTLSTHLARLCQAGLLRATRQRRRILYAIDVEGTRNLVAYLTEDCCRGRPEICGYGAKSAQGPGRAPQLENADG